MPINKQCGLSVRLFCRYSNSFKARILLWIATKFNVVADNFFSCPVMNGSSNITSWTIKCVLQLVIITSIYICISRLIIYFVVALISYQRSNHKSVNRFVVILKQCMNFAWKKKHNYLLKESTFDPNVIGLWLLLYKKHKIQLIHNATHFLRIIW